MVNTRIRALLISGTGMFAGTWGGGISYSNGNGYDWLSMNNGLTCPYISDIRKSGDILYACTMGSGLFLSADNANTWNQRNNGLTNPYVTAMAMDGGKLFSGTQGGGLFFSADTGKHWSAVNNGLTNLNITALAISAGRVYIGTWGEGIFVSTNDGNSWQPCNIGLNCKQVNTIATNGQEMYAGTTGGVYHSNDEGLTWNPAGNELSGYDVSSLAFCLQSIFAATGGHGVFISDNQGESWKRMNIGLSDSSVNILVLNNMSLFAGTSRKGVWMSALSDIFTLKTNPDTLVLDRDAGNKKNLFIKTSVEWTLQGFLPDWLAVNKRSGTGNDSLVFQTLKANTGASRRDATLYLFSPKAKTATFTVSQRGKSEDISENEIIDLQVFPNPSPGIVTIKSALPVEKIRIYNPLGEMIREVLAKANEVRINLSGNQSGVYYIYIYLEKGMICRNIVIL